MAKYKGRYRMNKDCEVYEIEGKNIVLNRWNTEEYFDCFEVNEDLIETISKTKYLVKPIYKEIDEDECEIIDYKIIEEY